MEREYLTLRELHKSGLIWWIKSVYTLRKWVEADKAKDNILKTIIVGEGIKRRYKFRKEDVENYVKSFTEKKEVKRE